MDRILIVDDESSMRDMLSILLKKEKYEITTASNCAKALGLLDKEIFDLIITDIKMPNGSGMDILKAVKKISNNTVVIMMTAYGTTENAVEAMKLGAYDYIIKPFKVDEVKLVIKNALEKRKLKEENQILKKELKELSSYANIIGNSKNINKIFELIDQIAPTMSNVMISGETGTGKELVARAIHFKGKRHEKPFVTINCSAVPEALLESELFGHMKGAFTGAYSNKQGLFEVADGGSIFLDEIGDMPITTQVKLLRVLQEREIRRLGGLENIKVDIRIIAATNKDLEESIIEGTFREDLYYRLSVIPIHLPPLRERNEDIPLLASHFIQKYTKIAGKQHMEITEDSLALLMNMDWPGNIRELENIMERIVALNTKKMITSDDIKKCNIIKRKKEEKGDIPSEVPPEGVNFDNVIGSIEKKLLLSALQQSDWRKQKAAHLLKMDFRSFRYKLDKYSIKKRE